MDSGAWDERYTATELVWGREPNAWIARETADLPPGRALDLAAGEGRNALWLAGRGWWVDVVDFSSVALDRGRELAAALPGEAAGRLTWVRADVLSHRPPRGAYDLVVIAYLHLPAGERRPVLRRAAEAVAPGGTLLVIGHDMANLTEGTGGPQDPRVLFTSDDVLADVAGTGLETESAGRLRRPVAAGPGRPAGEAVDAVARLRRPPGGKS